MSRIPKNSSRKGNLSLYHTLLASSMFASSNFLRRRDAVAARPVTIEGLFGINPKDYIPSKPRRRSTKYGKSRRLANKRARQARRITRLRS